MNSLNYPIKNCTKCGVQIQRKIAIQCERCCRQDSGREYERRVKLGIKLISKKKNKNGEGSIDSSGYKTITRKGHPNSMDARGRIREHVFLMSEHLGRPIHKGETVHHKNGNKLDNRLENLELWDRSQPAGQRVEDRIKYYIDFLEQCGYRVIKK